MKILYLLTVISFYLNIHQAKAQQKIEPGEFNVKNGTYKVQKLNDSLFFVANLNQNVPTEESDPGFLFVNRQLVNKDLIKPLILDALGANKELIKENKESILLDYSLLPNGKIISVAYIVNIQTKLSIQDIANIDYKLKNCFIGKIKSTQNLHLKLNSIPFTMELNLY